MAFFYDLWRFLAARKALLIAEVVILLVVFVAVALMMPRDICRIGPERLRGVCMQAVTGDKVP